MPCSRAVSRMCHVCGDRIIPQEICSSCGHLRCQQCTREFSEATTTDAPQVAAAAAAVCAASAPARPEISEVVSAETPLARQDKRASNKSEKSLEIAEDSEPPPSGKEASVKNNPFVIADQIAKAKVAEPQTSKTTIRATSVSKLPPCVVIRNDQHEHATHKQWEGQQQQQPDKAPCQSHNPFFHNHPTDESAYQKTIEAARIAEAAAPHNVPSPYPASISSQDRCPRELEWQFGQHNVITRAPAGSLKVAEARWSPKPSMAEPAEPAAQKELSHVIRRVKAMGRESKAGAGPVEKVPKVDVSATGAGRHVPKVRVSSPPFWLKNPSTKAGSIEGRLKKTGSRSNPEMSSSRPSQPQQRVVEDEFRHSHHMEDMPFAVNRGGSMAKDKQQQQHLGEGKRANLRADSGGGVEQIRLARRSLQTISSRETLGSLSSDTVTGTGRGKKDTPPGHHQKTPSGVPTALASHHRQPAPVETQRPGMVADMMCRQHGGEMEAERAQRAERMGRRSLRVVCEPEEGGEGEDGDDVGIRGLTIVLHLRGKDDLVISTDLSRDATASSSQSAVRTCQIR
ncbi:hypothetical protein B0T22DRAFT_3226 [Podospora appendiculata]|uniref:Uncharacterized protein n=1 Tax=Podospora appendiculata TaxID=314037 RepID=A0AAE1CEZ9_9PEZI|nr:hypothetical protein B0T22DRAFT_3226 [Podospora appendiculata]